MQMQATRVERTHPKHGVDGCDAGRVETQRLVKCLRFLPRFKQRHIRCGARCLPGNGREAGDSGARSAQGRALLQIGGRPRGGEVTLNM